MLSYLPMINWSIDAGNVITVFVLIITASMFIGKIQTALVGLKDDVDHLEKRQDALNDAFNQLGKILTQVAVQDNRLNMMEKNIDELRHGRGYIRPPKNVIR